MERMTQNQAHYGALDGLRALAAVGIVLMHVEANGYELKGFVFERLIPSFTNLVFLFMIISGFAMCCGYYDKIVRSQITVEEFYSRRYAKLWPYFALLCLLDLLISPSLDALYETFANLTLCFGLLPNAKISVIGVGWFLGVVFVFYLLFPFFCYLLSDKKRAWLSFFAALVFNFLCAVYFFDNAHMPENYEPRTNFVYCAVFFLGGGLIFLYREQAAKAAERYRWVLLAAGLILTVGYYVMGSSVPIMLALFAVFLIYALGRGSRSGILQNPVMKFLSSVSMEIYLCHMMVYRVIERLGMTDLFSSEILSYAATAVGTLAGSVLFAVLVKSGFNKIKRGRKHG